MLYDAFDVASFQIEVESRVNGSISWSLGSRCFLGHADEVGLGSTCWG